jgi:hypothetical protein
MLRYIRHDAILLAKQTVLRFVSAMMAITVQHLFVLISIKPSQGLHHVSRISDPTPSQVHQPSP